MLTSQKKHDKMHFAETIVIGIYKNLATVRSHPKKKRDSLVEFYWL